MDAKDIAYPERGRTGWSKLHVRWLCLCCCPVDQRRRAVPQREVWVDAKDLTPIAKTEAATMIRQVGLALGHKQLAERWIDTFPAVRCCRCVLLIYGC